jgi:hypothetical protein
MRLSKVKAAVALTTLVTAAGAALPAAAAPYVDIRARWSANVDPLYPLPADIAVSCYGDAGGGSTGCGGNLSLNTPVTTSGHLSATFSGGVVLTNTSNDDFTGYVSLSTDFSAFNPGGPGIGVSIDDALTEGARFRSSVSGEGVLDIHSCSVGLYGQSGAVYSPTACGVSSPDSSQSHAFFTITSLAPGESIEAPYSMSIDCDFIIPPPEPPADSGVPEPASAGVLLAGLLGLRLKKRA